MTGAEAASIIEAIAASLRHNPSQFTINLNIIGAQGIAKGGGTGIHASAHGGGIGMITSARTSDVRVSQGQASEEERRKLAQAVEFLDTLSQQLKLEKPDRSVIANLVASIIPLVPDVIAAVVRTVMLFGS